ncbi:Trehalose/maltose import ATP-binding protein MalK [uncultured archaeon]|nr:Trehalose/maltose import ATP-binding protein MalK [uncultured archaeon]
MELKMENISIRFGNWAMENLSLDVPSGSFLSIVGPSGCGKTTLLRIIAGLEEPAHGKVFFGSRDVTNVFPEDRDVGFVFQGDSLFSHLDIFGNVAFGPRMKRESGIDVKVAKALELVHLAGMEKRRVTDLSGGEKKRVAISRAIAVAPKMLLLDEPFNGLDGNLRGKMKALLKSLQKKTGLTVLMVTHDLRDAFGLADKVIVLRNGKVEQEGTPKQIISRPKSQFVKDFISD